MCSIPGFYPCFTQRLPVVCNFEKPPASWSMPILECGLAQAYSRLGARGVFFEDIRTVSGTGPSNRSSEEPLSQWPSKVCCVVVEELVFVWGSLWGCCPPDLAIGRIVTQNLKEEIACGCHVVIAKLCGK